MRSLSLSLFCKTTINMSSSDTNVDSQPERQEQPSATSWAQLQPQTVESYAPWSRNAPNRPQAVSFIGFSLGILFTLGLSLARSLPCALAEPQASVSLFQALQHPVFGCYMVSMSVFHMSEYLTTAIYNPTQVKVGCKRRPQHLLSPSNAASDNLDVFLSTAYLLHNGLQYHIAHLAGVLEFVFSEAYLPESFKSYKHIPVVTLLGADSLLIFQLPPKRARTDLYVRTQASLW